MGLFGMLSFERMRTCGLSYFFILGVEFLQLNKGNGFLLHSLRHRQSILWADRSRQLL